MACYLLLKRERRNHEDSESILGERESMSTKIISLDKQRRLKELKRQESVIKGYLSKLKQEELQYEANYIMNKVNEEELSEEFLLRGALLMDELAKRMDANKMANTINLFSQNLRKRLDDKFLQ